MTADEIRTVPAGRELDALIGRTVFGWAVRDFPVWHSHDTGEPEPCPFCERPEDYGGRCYILAGGLPHETSPCHPGEHGLEIVPAFSTDIAAAWLVVERLKSPYVKIRVEDSYWHCGYCTVVAADPANREDDDIVVRDALCVAGDGTVPHAICLAALLATRPY